MTKIQIVTEKGRAMIQIEEEYFAITERGIFTYIDSDHCPCKSDPDMANKKDPKKIIIKF